jgi:hypothetical protein
MTRPRAEPLGVVRSLPIDVYHADRSAISNSGLNDMRRSPRHFHALHLDPLRPAPEDKPSHLHGNLAHCATLEPDEFDKRYKVGPINDKRLVEWKDWAKDIRKQVGGGVTLITPNERAIALAQAESIRSKPDVAALMSAGWPEVSAYWLDPITGVRCRCRPDWRSPTGKRGRYSILLDVKTYSNADPDEFRRQVERMAYHQQAAFYSDGYAIASQQPVVGFVFVVVEDSYPFMSSAVMLDDDSLEAGRRLYRGGLDAYAKCLRENVWPGYSESIELIRLSSWRLQQTN